MDEQDIELLKTLIDTQNITKTAKKLYTTQSSLTKRIQKMEQDLGCQLFIRSRKGILPTPAAEGIFPEIEKISQSMEHIRAYALSLQGEICGSLKIGVSVNIARYKLPAVLKTFMKKYPKVDIYVPSYTVHWLIMRSLLHWSVAILTGRMGMLSFLENRYVWYEIRKWLNSP